ncbi:hypothetical protein C8J57DRAFT_1124191, partial [Mycena rebaudengoi]
MPLINNSTGFQIHGGNFYEVFGDVNLETHQHLTTIQEQRPDGVGVGFLGDQTLALDDGWAEESGRELSGVMRNPRHGMVARPAPYGIPSCSPSSPHHSSNLEKHTVGMAASSIASSSERPSIEPVTSPSSTSPRMSFPPESRHHLNYEHPNNLSFLGQRQHVPPTLPVWARDGSTPESEPGRQILDHHADSWGEESRHGDPMDYLRGRMIHGGTFISAENVNYRRGEEGIHILHRAVALEALYDSAESFPQPRCHPDTRTEMLEDLYNWAITDNSGRSIRWLHGPAGAGKSAIMQSLCQRLQDAGRLGGSFFFKRHHTTRGNAKVLFATLAYQLTLNNRHLKPLISRVVEDDPSVMARHMHVQLHKLVVEPCQSLNDNASPILLIDGLDECEGHDVQQEILRALANVAQDHLLRLRILIASRPELHIRDKFEHLTFRGLYDSVNIRQSFEDIRTYLRDEFDRIHHEHRQTMTNIPTPWPSPETLDKVVEKSSGYFIYASTLVKFIDDEDSRPAERLEVIQNLVASEYDPPFDALDQLYMRIL